MEVRPHRKINRKKTREIKVGKISVGGNSQISVQSMTNTLTTDIKATINQIHSLEDARILYATGIKLKITNEKDLIDLTGKLEELFLNKDKLGKCLVRIDYMSSGITKSLVLGENYKIYPTNDIINQLQKLGCVERVELIYSSI